MRVWIPATCLDYIAFALVLIGVVGMVAHVWLQEYGGMAWSAITVGTGILQVGVHVARRLRQASLPRAISAHIMLAFLNILAAAIQRTRRSCSPFWRRDVALSPRSVGGRIDVDRMGEGGSGQSRRAGIPCPGSSNAR
ncbi:MAG: hypothetical protein GEU82_04435 [Luteitalea sp.]|nr:hypothetical protein [Luteitalea sp.]